MRFKHNIIAAGTTIKNDHNFKSYNDMKRKVNLMHSASQSTTTYSQAKKTFTGLNPKQVDSISKGSSAFNRFGSSVYSNQQLLPKHPLNVHQNGSKLSLNR